MGYSYLIKIHQNFKLALLLKKQLKLAFYLAEYYIMNY